MMYRKYLIFILTGLIILLAISVANAQETSTCELDATEVITVVESVCTNTGNNELCYGNDEVEVAPRENAPIQTFDNPGDIMSLINVQSLYLSALNRNENLWGVAQMRLVTTTAQGPQEVTLLLYGDVEVDNAVDPTLIIPVETTASINIRSIPNLTGAVIASAPRGTILEAVGRLEDTSWVRVIVPETEAVGWLSGDFVQSTSDDVLADLDIMEVNENYFGPMQAFYINTGTNLSCNNVATDGLIIQTPEGVARVTILINEVTIELISSPELSATALVQANTVDGMTINMISGASVINANGSSYYLDGGMSTTIEMNENLQPMGEFAVPTQVEQAELLDLPLLTIRSATTVNATTVTDGSGVNLTNGTGTTPETTSNNDTNTSNNSNNTPDGNSSGDSSGNANGNSNGNSNGNANGNSNGNSNGNANGNSNGNTNGNSNGNSNGN